MKSSSRNFEAGIPTDKPALVKAASWQFDSVWCSGHCTSCGR
ncbi:hypothetical protein [uncultured Muribaculum sp.]|nr:hypothetical protein [uncultured Muribaculum sp.]